MQEGPQLEAMNKSRVEVGSTERGQ